MGEAATAVGRMNCVPLGLSQTAQTSFKDTDQGALLPCEVGFVPWTLDVAGGFRSLCTQRD
jgi:hypothetical protein